MKHREKRILNNEFEEVRKCDECGSAMECEYCEFHFNDTPYLCKGCMYFHHKVCHRGEWM